MRWSLGKPLPALTFYARAALDVSIDEAAEIFREYYGIDELGDPGIQAQVRANSRRKSLSQADSDATYRRTAS